MPVEIKELVIRTLVGKGAAGPESDAAEGPGAAAPADAGTEELVQECVRQVLRILEKHRER